MTTTTATTKITCLHCSGLGYFPKYMHIANGMCFLCGGEGKIECTASAGRAGTQSAVSPERAAARLREFYAVGASRKGADRTDWLDGLHEPYDSISQKAPIDVVRSCLSAVDATTASKARAAFANLGLSL